VDGDGRDANAYAAHQHSLVSTHARARKHAHAHNAPNTPPPPRPPRLSRPAPPPLAPSLAFDPPSSHLARVLGLEWSFRMARIWWRVCLLIRSADTAAFAEHILVLRLALFCMILV